MKNKLLLMIIISFTSLLVSVNVSELFQDHDIDIVVRNVTNNLSSPIQFSRGDNPLLTILPHDSAEWNYVAAPLRQSAVANANIWNAGQISISGGSLVGLLTIKVEVINNETLRFKVVLNLSNHINQLLIFTYDERIDTMPVGNRYIIDIVIGARQDESSISLITTESKKPR